MLIRLVPIRSVRRVSIEAARFRGKVIDSPFCVLPHCTGAAGKVSYPVVVGG